MKQIFGCQKEKAAGMALTDFLLQEIEVDQLSYHFSGAGNGDSEQSTNFYSGKNGVDFSCLVDPIILTAEIGAVVDQGVEKLSVAGEAARIWLLKQEGEELEILAFDDIVECCAFVFGHGDALPLLLDTSKGYT